MSMYLRSRKRAAWSEDKIQDWEVLVGTNHLVSLLHVKILTVSIKVM